MSPDRSPATIIKVSFTGQFTGERFEHSVFVRPASTFPQRRRRAADGEFFRTIAIGLRKKPETEPQAITINRDLWLRETASHRQATTGCARRTVPDPCTEADKACSRCRAL